MQTINVIKDFITDFIKQNLLTENDLLTNIASLIAVITVLATLLRTICNKSNINKNRPSCLSEEEVKKYIGIYIPTRLSCNNNKYRGKEFIKKCILNSSKQYHLVLGDTGTGKSSFLINSYFGFIKRLNKKDYSIFYYYLREPDALRVVSEISSKSTTILLLDAFDESYHTGKNAQEMLKSIEETTKEFAKIIITSRTHFFDTKSEVPKFLSTYRAVDIDRVKYQQYSVLPFSDLDVTLYLIKKYGFSFKKIFEAKATIKKSKDIMSRPLLLSYIDELLSLNMQYQYSYEIYDVILNNCIEREIKFISLFSTDTVRNNEKKHNSDTLKEAFGIIAKVMYENIQKHGKAFISKENLESLDIFDDAFFKNHPKRVRSLLERNSDDTFSFSHKSIFEYLISINIEKIENFKFDKNLDQAYKFMVERYKSGDKNIESVICESPEIWYQNIVRLRFPQSTIEYTNNEDDGMIFEFESYDRDFIISKIEEICNTLENQYKYLHKYEDVYSIPRISRISCELQGDIKEEDVALFFSKISKIDNVIPTYKKSTGIKYTKIQIVGKYEKIYS